MKKLLIFLTVFFAALLTFLGSSFAFDLTFISVTSPAASLALGLGLWGFSFLRRKRLFKK
ncbi:MAG: PEP-CTERM sorting domain-containing protein [Desulfobacteraceae bacterium]|nr:MAG: PEP-CTERM sorting domain-containing protein [Desulfobacteraceae bacterium]